MGTTATSRPLLQCVLVSSMYSRHSSSSDHVDTKVFSDPAASPRFVPEKNSGNSVPLHIYCVKIHYIEYF